MLYDVLKSTTDNEMQTHAIAQMPTTTLKPVTIIIYKNIL